MHERPSFLTMVGRALRLRCPLCGRSRVFCRWLRVRSMKAWLQPKGGCGRCGYAYEREPGYFLLATWVINYGVVCGFGLALWGLLAATTDLGTRAMMWAVLAPMPLCSIGLARHAKALWLAIDHWFDPHTKRRGDND